MTVVLSLQYRGTNFKLELKRKSQGLFCVCSLRFVTTLPVILICHFCANENGIKATTQAALRKRGITYAADLRLASDEILDQVIDELISMDMPPMPVAWAHLEEMVSEVQYYGVSTIV